MQVRSLHGNREISYLAASEVMERSASGRRGAEADEARQEKSDLFIIALKPTNKPGRLGAELVEPRERTEGNMGEQHTYQTLRRIKRVPEARLCTRSCSWDSSLTTPGGSPVRESRPPGSVPAASRNGCPYRDSREFEVTRRLSFYSSVCGEGPDQIDDLSICNSVKPD